MIEIGKSEGLRLLREMLRIRHFEEMFQDLSSLDRGKEAMPVGVLSALNPDAHGDALVAAYREYGHALARGLSLSVMMADGSGDAMPLLDASKRFFGGNAMVGGGIPIAVGLALADRTLARSSIVVCFFRGGAPAESVILESLKLAALWNLPVLFLCEKSSHAMESVSGVQSERVDGMDLLAVMESTARAVGNVRTQKKPRLIEFLTYKRDPIQHFSAYLSDRGLLSPGDVGRLEQEVETEISQAVAIVETKMPAAARFEFRPPLDAM